MGYHAVCAQCSRSARFHYGGMAASRVLHRWYQTNDSAKQVRWSGHQLGNRMPARSCRHCPGDRWFVDETYVKVAGRWVYLYRAIDQFGQVIDVLVSERRDLAATRRFFTRAPEHGPRPSEVTTDRAPAYPRVLDELLPVACHVVACHVMEQYANNPIEPDHGWLKARLRPMRGLSGSAPSA